MDKLGVHKDLDETIPSFSYSVSADTSPSLPLTPNVPQPHSSDGIMWDSGPSYEWCIQGDELQSLQHAAHEQGFESPEFKLSNHPHKTIQTIPFKLEIYPNGYFGDDINSCQLKLICVELPSNVSKVRACITLRCKETQIRFTTADEFSYDGCSCEWNSGTMTLDQIRTLQDAVTLQCWIHILTLHFEEDKRTGGKAKRSFIKMYDEITFEWNLDSHLVRLCTNCSVGQSFCSQSVGHFFWLQLMPNGYTADTKGIVKLYLESVGGLPSGLRAIKLKYDIECEAMHFRKAETVKLKKRGYSAIANFNFGKLRDLRKHSCLTMKCHLSVQSAYDSKKQSLQRSVWTKYGILMDHLQIIDGKCISKGRDQGQDQDHGDAEDEKVKEDPKTEDTAKRTLVDLQHFPTEKVVPTKLQSIKHFIPGDASLTADEAVSKLDDSQNDVNLPRSRSGGIVIDFAVEKEQKVEHKEEERDAVNDAVHRLIPGFFEVKSRESKSLLSNDPSSDSTGSLSTDDQIDGLEAKSLLLQAGHRKTNQLDPKSGDQHHTVNADGDSRFDVIQNTDDDGVDNEEAHDVHIAHSEQKKSRLIQEKDTKPSVEVMVDDTMNDRKRNTVEIRNVDDISICRDGDQKEQILPSNLGRFIIEQARSQSVLSNLSAVSLSNDRTSSLSEVVDPNSDSAVQALHPQRLHRGTKSKSASESPVDLDANDGAVSGPHPPLFVLHKSMTPSAGTMPSSSNNVSPLMASPYEPRGRFCVRTGSGLSIDSVVTNQSWNELKENMDQIDERLDDDLRKFNDIENAMKEMKGHQESETIRWTERFNKLCQSVETLTKSVKEIKSVQLNMMLIMESHGRRAINLNDVDGDGRTDALRQWLCDTLHLEEYFDTFAKEGFGDVSLLVHLEEKDLIELNVNKMAHRKKLLHAIDALRCCFRPREESFVSNGYLAQCSRESLSEQSTVDFEKDIHGVLGNIVQNATMSQSSETQAFVD